MAITKEDLKREIGDLIWKMATNLVHGGKVSSVQFMDYTLGALFYRFISENITDYCNHLMTEAGVANADYLHMSDEMAENARNQIVQAKGFFIKPSQLFKNVADGAKNNDELNTTLANNFKAIEESAIGTVSEDDVRGLFSNFNTNDAGLGSTVEERNGLLTTLLESVRDLPFTKYMDSGLDVFGICYEHLIKMYALNSGTTGGEFYTPAEVSYLLAQIAAAGRKTVNKVYDPACGSGSLLLNFNLVLGSKNVREGFFGQEINLKTYNLCRMNMFLHNVNYDHFDIQLGDTLLDPKHEMDEPFDAIVSNPPYMLADHGIVNPDSPKAIARHEVACTLDDVIGQGAKVLRPGGRFYMIHRPFRLVEIYACFTSYGLEPKRTRLVYPYLDKEPSMVLIEAVRGGRPRITIEKPLIVYESPGRYTKEIIDDYGF